MLPAASKFPVGFVGKERVAAGSVSSSSSSSSSSVSIVVVIVVLLVANANCLKSRPCGTYAWLAIKTTIAIIEKKVKERMCMIVESPTDPLLCYYHLPHT